jgi:hypothetical protein
MHGIVHKKRLSNYLNFKLNFVFINKNYVQCNINRKIKPLNIKQTINSV